MHMAIALVALILTGLIKIYQFIQKKRKKEVSEKYETALLVLWGIIGAAWIIEIV